VGSGSNDSPAPLLRPLQSYAGHYRPQLLDESEELAVFCNEYNMTII